MKILVLGGTGAIGVDLVQILADRGSEVHVTSRQERKSKHRNIIYIKGNAQNKKFLDSLLITKYDAIVDFMSYDTDTFAERVGSLLDHTKQYVYLSSSRVYADIEGKQEYDQLAEKVVYTGAIDAYFDYCLGNLEYRSVRFENEVLDIPNFQGNAAVNYTDRETPWTRIIEHKWFEFGKDEDGNDLPKTVISREYSSEWKPGDEPYYPVNDEKNSNLYKEYKKMADAQEKVIFGGRLGEYKYYDMDQVIAAALEKCEKELK